jgi:N-acetylglucosamine-6-phosphate deacetylase
MNNNAITQTTGRWWTTNGFVDGICHHNETVQSIEVIPQLASCPMFLPAPVDLHVHGGGGHDCMSGEAAIRGTLITHAQHGTGSLLATSVTAPFKETSEFVKNASRVMSSPDKGAATLLGVHLEGPFINPDKLGAQPPFATGVNLDQLESWLDSGIVKVITYAPELDPKGDLITLCNRYDVRVQIGHTNCSWQQAHEALLAGCGVTHLYNAMSGVTHRKGGAATAALAYAEFAEIILDGLHVDRAAFDVARRAIPKLYSVTDATAASGMPDGSYMLGSLSVRKENGRVLLADGTTAGSCLTQTKVIALMREWDIDWHTIGAMISAIPASWIKNDVVGNIALGATAHWLEICEDVPVALWLSGKRIALP